MERIFRILLPCPIEVFSILQKLEFEIKPDLGCTACKTSRKVVLDNPSLCVCVCRHVCLAVAFAANSLKGVSFKRSHGNLRGMFCYTGHCVVTVFLAIREPVHKIILWPGFGVRNNLGKYFPIVMKFPEYLLSCKETSAIDFGLDGSIRSAVHGPEVGQNELDCASVCE